MKETRTLLSLSLLFMAAYIFFSYKSLLFAAFILVIIAISSEKLRGFIAGLVFRLAKMANRFLTGILLAFIYMLILTPVAGLQRFFFQNPVLLKPEDRDSLFSSRNHIYTAKDFENPW